MKSILDPDYSEVDSILTSNAKPLGSARDIIASEPHNLLIQPEPNFDSDDFRTVGDVAATRKQIFLRALEAAQNLKPVSNNRFTLQLKDVHYLGKDTPTKAEHKKALLTNGYLARKMSGRWELVDNATGRVVSSKTGIIAHIPYLTSLGTIAKGGNDYTLSHQFRLRPGVYTRWQDNGELEAHVNVSGGIGHKIFMEPETGIFKMKFGQASIPATDVLSILGVSDREMEKAWGPDLFIANIQKSDPKALNKLYQKLTYGKGTATSPEEKKEAIRQVFAKMGIDPTVSKATLGQPYDKVTPEVLLETTKKLVRINKGQAETDSRDNMAFQRLFGPEDIIADRISRGGNQMRQALWKMSAKQNLDKMPSGLFDKLVEGSITETGLGQPIEEVNTLELMDNQFRVTRLGEGGIASIDAIPDSARNVHPSQLGFTDVLRTPESLKAGVDARMTNMLKKDKHGNIYTKVRDRNGNEHWKSAQEIASSVVAFPNELRTKNKFVSAVINGKMRMVPRETVDYEFPTMQNTQHAIGQMVPMTSGVKGQRSIMAARMITQALPLEHGEAPWVQSGIPDSIDESYEERYGENLGAVRAKEPMEIISVNKNEVKARTRSGEVKTFEMYKDMAFNRKTGINQEALVRPGDIVKPGDTIIRSNFTNDKGTMAVGLNTKVCYLPYKGLNYEDGFVVSESFAKKMASTHYYKNRLPIDKLTSVNTNQFLACKPGVYTKDQLANFTPDGLIKPGTVVHTGDPLILAVNKVEPSEAQLKMGRKASWRDSSVTWDHHDDGVVTDVFQDAKGAQVVVKTRQELKEADKISGRYGNKGVIAKIIPDSQMPTLEDGTKPELLISTLAITSRVNPAQIVECILGKIAAKTGKRYAVKDFDKIDDLVQFAIDEAKKYGIKDCENLIDDTDPDHPKVIPHVLSGNSFWMKLHHSAESKAQGRGIGRYTMDGQPAKGGDDGAKRMGMLELSALLSHGATNNIADIKYVKGQENLDYWRQYMAGYNPPTPRVPYVYDKFVNYLKGAGINVVRDNTHVNIMALTAKDVDDLTGNREITGVPDKRTGLRTLPTVAWDDALKALPGGLFDPGCTGGHSGNQWSYFKLNEKLPNPIMEQPLRLMLGMTEAEFRDVMGGKKSIPTGTGPSALYKAACNLNIANELEKARDDIRSGKKTYRDAAIKRLGYLKSAQQLGQEPKDWFMDKCPVIPPYFRPVSVMSGSKLPLVADPNYLYKALFDVNQVYGANKKMFGEDNSRELGLQLYDAFKAVTGISDPTNKELQSKNVNGFLKHVFGAGAKYSMIQTKMLGTPADLTGRGVISCNPDYDMDTIGLPENIAWETYQPLIIRRLRQYGRNGMTALHEVENKSEAARKVLQEIMEERPVLLNRAPTLHKFGIMALMPKLIKGDTIKINPFICAGMAADFDGDGQIGYVFLRVKRESCPLTSANSEKNYFTEINQYDIIPLSDEKLINLTEENYSMQNKCGITLKSNNYDFGIIDLENFPRLEKINESQGQWGTIDWYAVPEEVEVLAYNEENNSIVWTHPTVFSIHHECPIIIVTTNNNRQIHTDDDPRAIYGINPETFEMERCTPFDAIKKHIIIPRMKYAESLVGDEYITSIKTTSTSHGRVYRLKEELPVDENLGYIFGAIIGDGWVSNNRISLADKDFDTANKLTECFSKTTVGEKDVHSYINQFNPTSYGESHKHTWGYAELGDFVTSIIGSGCRNKHLPVWFLNTPESFRKGLFAGLMDTDGGVGISHGEGKPRLTCNYTTTCFRLAREVVLLAASINIAARITTSHTPAGLPCWAVSFSTTDIKKWGGEYMASTRKVRKIQETEVAEDSASAARTNLVPISVNLCRAMMKVLGCKEKRLTEEDERRYADNYILSKAIKRGYISRPIAKRALKTLEDYNLTVEHEHLDRWKEIVNNEEITWEYIKDINDTKICVTGYDLTVPGSDTFVNSDGIVLSNTMVFHVPTTKEATEEAMERMLPSKNLLSPGDFSVVPKITKEHAIGLYEGTRPSNEKATLVFATKKDVVDAWKRGELNPRDKVKVLSDK